jgi:hypothetical protein
MIKRRRVNYQAVLDKLDALQEQHCGPKFPFQITITKDLDEGRVSFSIDIRKDDGSYEKVIFKNEEEVENYVDKVREKHPEGIMQVILDYVGPDDKDNSSS